MVFTSRIWTRASTFDDSTPLTHLMSTLSWIVIFIMKIIYLFIGLCILSDGARISHHPRIFKYRKNISLSEGYSNIGFHNEKVYYAFGALWLASIIKLMGMTRLMLNHPHPWCVCVIRLFQLIDHKWADFLFKPLVFPFFCFSSRSSANETDSARASSNESNVSWIETTTLISLSLSAAQRSKNTDGTTITDKYLSSQSPLKTARRYGRMSILCSLRNQRVASSSVGAVMESLSLSGAAGL